MAAPIAAQKLRHGKALCKAVFGGFVDTFNWLVDLCSSLKGDRDANPAGDGRITVDRSDPSAPVIRCTGCKGGDGDVDLDLDYFKVQNKDVENDGGHALVEMDARVDSTPALRVKRLGASGADGADDTLVLLEGGSYPQVRVMSLSGPFAVIKPAYFLARTGAESSSPGVRMEADSGSHNVIIRLSDATQGDVQLRACNYYDGSANQPILVNVLSSQVVNIPSAALLNVNALTGVSFNITNGNLVATLSKQNLLSQQTSTSTVTVCSIGSLSVVTNTDYTNPNFTQTKKTISVIGTPSSGADSTVFTTTPHSAE